MLFRTLDNIPLDNPLETDLKVYQTTHSITSLREPLMESEHGANLATLLPRFERYWEKWDDIEKFVEVMGPDVDPVQHGPYQARTVAIPLIEEQIKFGVLQFKTAEAHAFVAHHVQHDDHEGTYAKKKKMLTDVLYSQKTPEIEAEEFELWEDIQRQLFGANASFQQIKAARIFEKSDGFRSYAWKISELIGYIATGMQSVYNALELKELTTKERENSWDMGRKIVGHHYPRIKLARDQIALCDNVIQQADLSITAICKHYAITREELLKSERAKS